MAEASRNPQIFSALTPAKIVENRTAVHRNILNTASEPAALWQSRLHRCLDGQSETVINVYRIKRSFLQRFQHVAYPRRRAVPLRPLRTAGCLAQCIYQVGQLMGAGTFLR